MNARLPLREQALATLRLDGAPRVFSPQELQDWCRNNEVALPERSQTQALIEWTAAGVLGKINNHTYLNLLAHPRPLPDEAAAHLRPGAVVSLTRVLGQAGVLNNPTHWITAVVSIERTRKVGEVVTAGGTFAFAALPEALLPNPLSDLGRDAYEPFSSYLRATPEKAYLDGLYLQSTPRGAGRWERPQDGDWDLDVLDQERLLRLAQGLDLVSLLPEGLRGMLDAAPSKPRGRRP
jgi:hypothetical protein